MLTKEDTFFRKVVSSIKDIEKYPEMAIKPFSTIIIYLLKLLLILTLIATLTSIYVTSKSINSGIEYIKDELPNFEYSNKQLKFNTDKEIIILPDSIIDKIIINTNDIENEKIEKYKDEISEQNSGIILLKDKLIIHINNQFIDYLYENIDNNYNINNLNKEGLLEYLTGSNLIMIYIGIFVLTFISLFISYTLSAIIDIFALGIVGYFTALILRIRLRIKAILKITIYSLTLPIFLNILYVIEQAIWGYNVKYFEIMYISITYIYIISAILMIKSDLIKRGQELTKIVEEEQKVKEEIERKEREEQEQKEKQEQEEKKEKEDNNQKNKKNNNKKDDDSKEEPQGENA